MSSRPISFSLMISEESSHIFQSSPTAMSSPEERPQSHYSVASEAAWRPAWRSFFENVYHSWFLSLIMGPLNHTFVNIAIKKIIRTTHLFLECVKYLQCPNKVKWTDFISSVCGFLSPLLSVYVRVDNRLGYDDRECSGDLCHGPGLSMWTVSQLL